MLPDVSDIITVTNKDLFFRVEEEYQEALKITEQKINNYFILEPFSRDTAPAVASACLQALENYGEDAILLILAADHLVLDQDAFNSAVNSAIESAQSGKIATFGIKPTSPETGYGYIEANGTNVIRFIEKPTIDKAKEYLLSGNFLWNSGMLCFRVSTMLQEMTKYSNNILQVSRSCLGASKVETRADDLTVTTLHVTHFHDMPANSIDYAVMEKTSNAAVISCNIGWTDIGCWRSLGDQTEADANCNRIRGDAIVFDSHNCSVIANGQSKIVGLVGVKNLVVVDTPDALLVVDKKQSQNVKRIYNQLKQQNHKAHKQHRKVYRPWGTYTILEDCVNFKVKRIEVKPGARLNLKSHHHLNEHWILVSGIAKVINGDNELILNINESTFIPATNKHRLENIGKTIMVMIEIQTRDYLGKDSAGDR